MCVRSDHVYVKTCVHTPANTTLLHDKHSPARSRHSLSHTETHTHTKIKVHTPTPEHSSLSSSLRLSNKWRIADRSSGRLTASPAARRAGRRSQPPRPPSRPRCVFSCCRRPALSLLMRRAFRVGARRVFDRGPRHHEQQRGSNRSGGCGSSGGGGEVRKGLPPPRSRHQISAPFGCKGAP